MAVMVAIAYFAIQNNHRHQKAAQKIIKKTMASGLNEPMTLHPEIDPGKCAGCAACTAVCPEGDILKMVNHKAVLVAPSKCVGHGECERACPVNAIALVFGTKTRGMDIPRLNSNYETNVSGLYIAGELGGMGLIRNAVKQGVLAAQDAITKIKSSEKTDTDLFIVGGGPAGLAAGLAAIANRKSYICIDQNSFGGTVYNFPRQKVVMSHPADLPIVGKMQFPSNKVSKEQLLGYWSSVRKKTNLKIKEKVKFEGLEKKGEVFLVKTNEGSFTAKKVILAMGTRGSPRKLGLPNEELEKVTYNLLDPQQYQNTHVAVVGGGNAGVEAAQYLAKAQYKNKVTLLVRGPTFDRCNEDNQKIIFDMEKKGLVEIWYEASVKTIEKDYLIVTKKSQEQKLDNNYLFVFAGAELPHKFLMSLGIQIDKKFGESLKKSS